eukprot:TRINITY_DN118_c0_g2_i1.p2 TRINITY_DN118_c0_g2~~TRINITY_DN118_c0_g2_i1.p2  ORF type:complete len:102 (-),score=23.51 TRINITY_DN118_c0_g2_i1:823-1128(-)
MTDSSSSDEDGSGASSSSDTDGSDTDGSDALPSNSFEVRRERNFARNQAHLANLMPAVIAAKRQLEATVMQRRSHLAVRFAARKAAKEAAAQQRSGRVIEV